MRPTNGIQDGDQDDCADERPEQAAPAKRQKRTVAAGKQQGYPTAEDRTDYTYNDTGKNALIASQPLSRQPTDDGS